MDRVFCNPVYSESLSTVNRPVFPSRRYDLAEQTTQSLTDTKLECEGNTRKERTLTYPYSVDSNRDNDHTQFSIELLVTQDHKRERIDQV